MLRNLYFNQIILINITIWKRQNSIEIEDFASKTIKSFQNVVFGDDLVTIEDWKKIEKSHPDCMVRIYRLMFAKKE